MDDDFLLSDFSLENTDFDFDVNLEINLSTEKMNIDLQKDQCSLDFDNQKQEHNPNSNPKPKPNPTTKNQTTKINNKPQFISFDLSNNVSSPSIEKVDMDPTFEQKIRRKMRSSNTKSSIFAKEHVLAERKRRETLSKKFIALSALIPGLKKTDKITVLDDAISHLKQLQKQINKLEEEKEARKKIESTISMKKSKVFVEENKHFDQTILTEIEAKVSQNEILIRIHCEKSKVCMINILNVIKNLRLSVVNSIVLPFGELNFEIIIVAQMEQDFSVTLLNDLVKNLRLVVV